MSEAVKVVKRGHVLEVTLDRPKANAIDVATSALIRLPSRSCSAAARSAASVRPVYAATSKPRSRRNAATSSAAATVSV